MFQQTHGLCLDQTNHHVAEDSANGIEAFIRGTDVSQPRVVEKDLLYNEDCHRLGKLTPGFHDSQTEGNDFRGQKKGDGGGGIIAWPMGRRSVGIDRSTRGRFVLDQGSDDAEGGQSKIFKGSGFGRGVEKGIQEQGDVSCGFVSQVARGDGSWATRY